MFSLSSSSLERTASSAASSGCTSRSETEHRPIQTGADRGRTRTEHRSLVGGLMGADTSTGQGRRGVVHPLPTAPLGSKGIGTMDKAWTTPPTVVPRADDAPTTDSPVNETQSQVGSRRRRRVGLRCRLSHHPRGRTGFKRNIAPLKREAALGMRCRRYCPPAEHRPFDRVGPKLSTRPTTTAQQPVGQACIRCYVGSLGRPPCDDAPPSTGLRAR